jgi:hypothetical protein
VNALKTHAKQLYQKMVDYKRFAIALLAVGAFFYLGVIIPQEAKEAFSLNIMAAASMVFLLGSIYFFSVSKKLRSRLSEMDEGEDFLMKK